MLKNPKCFVDKSLRELRIGKFGKFGFNEDYLELATVKAA